MSEPLRLTDAELRTAIDSLTDGEPKLALMFFARYDPDAFRFAIRVLHATRPAELTPPVPPADLPDAVRHLPLPTAPLPLTRERSDVLPPGVERGLIPLTTDESTRTEKS